MTGSFQRTETILITQEGRRFSVQTRILLAGGRGNENSGWPRRVLPNRLIERLRLGEESVTVAMFHQPHTYVELARLYLVQFMSMSGRGTAQDCHQIFCRSLIGRPLIVGLLGEGAKSTSLAPM